MLLRKNEEEKSEERGVGTERPTQGALIKLSIWPGDRPSRQAENSVSIESGGRSVVAGRSVATLISEWSRYLPGDLRGTRGGQVWR